MVSQWLPLLAGCFSLGMLHAVVPDEHTWPITFSYSVGSATGRGGIISGAFFGLAFTFQRSIMAQLFYFALVPYLAFDQRLNGPIYVLVGFAMAVAGYLILYRRIPHWHPLNWALRHTPQKHEDETKAGRVPTHWAVIHGFIAGFGVDVGLFTTFIYLVAVPSMPSALLGFAPGAMFGLGTLSVLVFIGLLFGRSLQVAKRWGRERVETFGSKVGARSLLYGGLVFIAAGLVYSTGVIASIPFDYGNIIIMIFMVVVIIPVIFHTWRETRLIPA